MKKFVIGLLIIAFSINCFPKTINNKTEIEKEIFIYSTKNQDTLCLDKYSPSNDLSLKQCIR